MNHDALAQIRRPAWGSAVQTGQLAAGGAVHMSGAGGGERRGLRSDGAERVTERRLTCNYIKRIAAAKNGRFSSLLCHTT